MIRVRSQVWSTHNDTQSKSVEFLYIMLLDWWCKLIGKIHFKSV